MKGEDCTFAHCADELEAPPDLSFTKLCRSWIAGQVQEHRTKEKEPSGPEETSGCRGAKNCRETIFVSQLSRNYPHRGGNFERGKNPLLWGRDSLGGILGDNLGEGNCESKIVSRQWGDNFCRETSRCLAGPSGREIKNKKDTHTHSERV